MPRHPQSLEQAYFLLARVLDNDVSLYDPGSRVVAPSSATMLPETCHSRSSLGLNEHPFCLLMGLSIQPFLARVLHTAFLSRAGVRVKSMGM